MTYLEFVNLVERLWQEIPEPFKRGVQGVHVLPEAKPEPGLIPFYAESLVLGHQWKRVCRLRVSGSWARTRHRSATTSIISSRS